MAKKNANTGYRSQTDGGSNHSPIDAICNEILRLIEKNPSIAVELAGLISKVKDLDTPRLAMHPAYNSPTATRQATHAPWSGSRPAATAGDHLIDPPRSDANRYEWVNEYLCEFNLNDNKARLKVNQDDYRTVATAIDEHADDHGTFSASDVHAHASRDDGHKVPLTQLYLCTRFWRERGLIQRAAGRRLKVNSTGGFAAAAEELILKRTA